MISLSAIDQILSGVAVAFLIGAGAWWIARSRRDPLSHAPSRPNRLREDALALVVLVYLTAAFLTSTLIRLGSGQTESVVARMAVGNAAHLAGIGACLFIAATRFQGGVGRFWFGQGRIQPRAWPALAAALTVLAAGLCPIIRDATISVVLSFDPDHQFDPHPTIQALHEHTLPVGLIITLWVGAVVLAPAAEELFFRGLLQTFLVSVVRSRWLAIGLTSLAFGAVHFQQPHAIGALAVLALFIGYAYERTGSLLPPIAIHAAFNLKTLLWDTLGGVPT